MDILFENLGTIIFLLFLLASVVAPAVRGQQQSSRRPQAPKRMRSELEERVRRNFEEMMNKRRKPEPPPTGDAPSRSEVMPSAAPAAPPLPAATRPAAPPEIASAQVTKRLVKNSPAPFRETFVHQARQVDRSWTSPHQKSPDSPWLTGDAAYSHLPGAHGESVGKEAVRRVLKNRVGIQTAIIMKEVLDVPIAFRSDDRFYDV